MMLMRYFLLGPLDMQMPKEKAYAEIDRLLTYIDQAIASSDHEYLVDDNFWPSRCVFVCYHQLVKPYSSII